MTDEEKAHRIYLALGEQVALKRAVRPLTPEASVGVITAQYNEIAKLKQANSPPTTSGDSHSEGEGP